MNSTSDIIEILRLDRQLCFPLYVASNLMTRLYRPILAELGLTYPQYLVMLALWQDSPRTVGALGEELHLDSGTLTPLLKRMESAGLVTRQRGADDERRVFIALTPKGKAMKSEAVCVPEKLAANGSLEPAQVESIRDMLQGLVDALSQQVQRPAGGFRER